MISLADGCFAGSLGEDNLDTMIARFPCLRPTIPPPSSMRSARAIVVGETPYRAHSSRCGGSTRSSRLFSMEADNSSAIFAGNEAMGALPARDGGKVAT